jgi:hypothetical protein
MTLWCLVASLCYVNAGWESRRIPAFSGIMISRHVTARRSTMGPGYHCVTTIGRSTSRPPLKAAGNTLTADGFLLICIPWNRGRTCFYILQSSRINKTSHRWLHAYHLWSNALPNSVGPVLRRATTSKSFIFDGFTPSPIGRN